MTLEKSSSVAVTQAELFTIVNGTIPEKLENSGFSLEELQAKVEAKEVEIVKGEKKVMSFRDVNKAP